MVAMVSDNPDYGKRPLTDRQAAVLRVIQESIAEKGYPPTLREIGLRLNIRSTNGVNDHLRALERKGYIGREDLVSRGLRLTATGQDSKPPPVTDNRVSAILTQLVALRTRVDQVIDALYDLKDAP